ncbi:MAG: tripartite tricarboxylate transporter substrate binding protein [Hyphomicrobiaceae bacterium]|nr:tripartite tricarboxylate transporter substrate binding protein [Hyphomicrobiaceae bacterium]
MMLRPLALLLALAAAIAPAAAQAPWPARTVRIMVPFGPGSTPDLVARLLAEFYQQELPGSTFVAENKPGASGNLGTEAVAKAEPDGTTIGVSIGGPLAINSILFSQMKYDPAKDIAPVSKLVTQSSILAVNRSMGVASVPELVAALKADPAKVTFGSIGTGSLSHLAMEAIAQSAGVKLVHLPMQGSPAAMTALLRNDVQLACLPSIAVTPHAGSGDIRMLAVSTPKRSPFQPDLPTLKESGIDVEADAWMGLIAPAGTPPAIIERLHALTVKALASAPIKERLAALQMEPVASTPAEFRAVIAAEVGRWAPVIKAAGIKIN